MRTEATSDLEKILFHMRIAAASDLEKKILRCTLESFSNLTDVVRPQEG